MKRFLAMILALALILMCTPAYAAGTQYAQVVTPTSDGSVYVRRVAGEGQPIVGAAKNGDQLIVLSRGNTWHKVKVVRTGVSGYMYGKYIRFTDYVSDSSTNGNASSGWGVTGGNSWGNTSYTPDASVKDADKVVNCDATVKSSDGYANLRWGPGTSYNAMGRVYNGDVVWALEQNGSWYRCRTADGRIGYISKGLLRLGNTSSSLYGKTGVIRSGDGFAAVRSGAGTSHTMLYRLYVGQTAAAYDFSGQWLRVENRDSWGDAYIHRTLLRFLWNAKTTGNVNFRSGPGTSHTRLGTLSTGTNVKLLATDGNFARVDTGSAIVYVSARYLKY